MSAIAILGSAAPPSRAGTGKAGAPCKLTAALPTSANDQVTGNGSIRCRTSRTVHAHIETQVMQLGQWGTFGSFDSPVHVKARKTHRLSTGPANCRGLGNATMRTVLRVRLSHRTLTKTSGTAEISCSGH